jgi:hypothetical protein
VVESQLSDIGDVTHIFYAALYSGKNVFDEVGPNLAMLTNLVEAVEYTSKQFRKVVLLEGAKYYGAHLGPYKTPAKEDDLLAKAIVWAAENDSCDGEGFNITNGDFNRWANLWPRRAEYFKMDYGLPQHLPLTQFMSDKAPIWQRLVKQHGLLDYSFEAAVSWPFGEAVFNIEYDVMSDTTKSRRYGFLEWVDTEEMLFRLFTQFQKMRFIPALRE